ncbi:hypothetical protein B0H65DRAFT_269821 [Neurospora tetraspora]|uniref:Uncharacterized protein n=1 Tax=Neurospora tetraspora TaxID=94610 RepID=A0AAE0JB97_9PEZI|nr:hypothetical protein B0H65DRAFT_269821 [Neurospora tetraspora]
MPNGMTPEEERRRQEQERRYQKAEEKARAAWQRGLENEREAAEALKEEKKTHAGKRRVSFDSSRNQTHLLYSLPPTIDSTPAESIDVGELSHELLQESMTEGYELIIKEIASLRAEIAEEEAVARKRQEHEAARIKYEAAWKEQERHRQKAEEKALKAKEAEESVLARIHREGEAARKKYHEALKRGLENERQSISQPHYRKPAQGSYPPKPSGQQNQPANQYPPSGQYHTKQDQHGHPIPHQRPPASSVPIGLSGLPSTESLCSGSSVSVVPVGLSGLPAMSLYSDGDPEVTRYKDEGRGRSGYADAYVSKQEERSHQGHCPSAPLSHWSTPPVPAWKAPTPPPQVTKHTLVMPTQRSYHAAVETPKEEWPIPPTPASCKIEHQVPNRVESEKEKLERELREAKAAHDRLCVELEKRRRGTGASSVASWQTGCKSVWEDPTKVTLKDTANDSSKDISKNGRNIAIQTEKNTPMEARKEISKETCHGAPEGRRGSSFDRNGRSLSRGSARTNYYEAAEYISSSDDDQAPKFSKAHARAKSLKLKLSVGTNPPYVPPTPYWHPSPPPSLPPTPPKRPSAPGPAVTEPSTSAFEYQEKYDYYEDIKTPYPPGSWWGDERERYRLVQ